MLKILHNKNPRIRLMKLFVVYALIFLDTTNGNWDISTCLKLPKNVLSVFELNVNISQAIALCFFLSPILEFYSLKKVQQ